MADSTMKSICDLLGMKFRIPNYQRGYRWTNFEAERLVDDLHSYFSQKKDKESKSYYCLQPLVVTKNNDNTWDVIDGQQRLTTIFLLLKYCQSILENIIPSNKAKELFHLQYQTRNNSEQFLEEIDKQIEQDWEYIDYAYMFNAYMVIKDYFKKKGIDPLALYGFFNNLISPDVRFIWYDVTNECIENGNYAKILFSRLNIGKIPLTNAELIKSLFLNSIYGQLSNSSILDKKKYSPEAIQQYYETIDSQIQYKIASDWDLVEQKLNIPDFWAFLYGNDDGLYSTRIELLFDILKDKPDENKDRFFTFVEYDKEFHDADRMPIADNNPDNLFACKKWDEVMELFNMVCSWYEERDIYHYVGFLRYKKMKLAEIKNLYDQTENHSSFLDLLREKSLEKINHDIDNLNYSDNDSEIRDILLLFNIASIQGIKSEERFSFSGYYSQTYDIEHIKPQTPKEFDSMDDKIDLIRLSLEYITGCRYLNEKDLQEENYEKELEEFAGGNAQNTGIISMLVEKRRNLRSYHSGISQKQLADIDRQLKQFAPQVRPRRVRKEQCINVFLGKIEEKGKNENVLQERGLKDLFSKLLTKYKSLTKGNDVDLDDFNPDEKKFLGIEGESGPDTIGNLVLLDSGTNRAYKNAGFIIKRYFIQEREDCGVYIPRCTKNVFNKMYSKNVAYPMRWTEDDMKDYRDDIKGVLKLNDE